VNVEVEHLSFAYGDTPVLEDVNFVACPGELVAVLGKNGCGKTTLLKNVNRLLRPKAGRVTIGGADVAAMSRREITRRVAYMPQSQRAVHCTVFDAVLLGKRARMDGCTRQGDHNAVAEVLRQIGMEDFAMRSTDELSGGELQKVVLGRALAQGPRVMLLDEPISHLDLVNQIEVMTLLHQATRSREMVSLMVTHDLNQSLRFADRFIMLRNGRIFAAGDSTVITPGSIREVYGIEATVTEVKGTPVIVPTLPPADPSSIPE